MAIRIIKKSRLRFIIPSILILMIALTQSQPLLHASTAVSAISGPALNFSVPTRTVTFTDSDLPAPPIEGMTFHFVAPVAGEFGPGKIRMSYQTLKWSVWFGVTNGKLWLYNLPKKESLPKSLQGFYDYLGIDESCVYTDDGKCWFTGLPPWLNISRYDPDVTELPTIIAAASTNGQATIEYSINGGSLTKTTLTSSSNPSVFGQVVTFTALVSGGNSPTGTVDFKDGVTALVSGVALKGPAAAYSTSTLSAGSHSISAVYNGDSHNTGGISPVLTQTVKAVINISSATPLPDGLAGIPYSQVLTASGGVTPYSWSIQNGALPAALKLNAATGAITGTPAAAGGPASVTFKVTDSTQPAHLIALKALSITINPSTLTVNSPNGGEKWALGSSQKITWSSAGITGNVNIQLSRNGGSTWTTIISNTPNDGNQAWTVTGPAAAQARVKVLSVSAPTVFDTGNANFSITQTITVNSPNGGESWAVGSSRNITWSSAGITGNVNIQISRNGGSTWTTIISNTPNDGNQAWKVTGPAAAQARVKALSVSAPTVFDTGNANFSIIQTITVNSPNGGESWAIGGSQKITWSSAGITGKVNIQISRNGGSTWTTIISNTPNDGNQAWKVSGPATAQARVKVLSVSSPTIFDTGNANFTISGP
jgi:hypothetical protein